MSTPCLLVFWFQFKDHAFRYWILHNKNKTVVRPFFFLNDGIHCTECRYNETPPLWDHCFAIFNFEYIIFLILDCDHFCLVLKHWKGCLSISSAALMINILRNKAKLSSYKVFDTQRSQCRTTNIIDLKAVLIKCIHQCKKWRDNANEGVILIIQATIRR